MIDTEPLPPSPPPWLPPFASPLLPRDDPPPLSSLAPGVGGCPALSPPSSSQRSPLPSDPPSELLAPSEPLPLLEGSEPLLEALLDPPSELVVEGCLEDSVSSPASEGLSELDSFHEPLLLFPLPDTYYHTYTQTHGIYMYV